MVEITERESAEVDAANASGRQPVVFVHGLWLLANSWDSWRKLFEEAGYATLAPGWPDDPESVQEGNEHPEVFAGKTVGQVAAHVQAVIAGLSMPPVAGRPFLRWPVGADPCRARPGQGDRRH